MFGIRFLKSNPTDYVLLFRGGKVRKQGPGLSFFYYAPSASVVIVPAASRDCPFIFNIATADFQAVDIQGQITYRVDDPSKLASMLDFTVSADGSYTGDGMEVLPVRLTNLVQVTVREKMESYTLLQALASAAHLVEHVKEKLRNSETMQALGLALIDFSILRISSTPEMSRALEASAREKLYKEADQAIYERRNFAVEQERIIKENELQTQIAIEEKNRRIREEQMNAELAVQDKQRLLEDAKMESLRSVEEKKSQIEKERLQAKVELESKRKDLIRFESENIIENARARAEAVRLEISAVASVNPDVLEVLSANQMDAKALVSKAMRDLARNAEKIGTLNITPDLLQTLIEKPKK